MRPALRVAMQLVVVVLAAGAGAFGYAWALRATAGAQAPALLVSGLAAMLVAACGLLGLVVVHARRMRCEIRGLEQSLERTSDLHWKASEAEERLRSLLEALGDLIVRRDQHGVISYVNEAYCALAARPPEQLIGGNFALSVDHQGEIRVLCDGTRAHDQTVATAHGPRAIAWRDVTIHGEGGVQVQSVGRDVTERVIGERALASARDQADSANQAKGRFLAMVSHEIRTPLNGILGMTELLLETPLSAEQNAYATAVRASGQTLLGLIEDILDFSKIEAGRMDLDARPFRIEALVEETVELLSPRAHSKGIDIAAYVDRKLTEEVIGDAARLRQVLLNLVGNAVKFTLSGGVSVVVEPGATPDEVEFAVSDTGIGVAPEARQRIFSEFEQAERGATRRFGGSGLGLAISRRILERMGGRISFDSEPSVGSIFRFALSLPRVHPANGGSEKMPNLAGAQILVVAPNPVEASFIARRLGSWGAHARLVTDAETALRALGEAAWGALVVDRAIGGAAAIALARVEASRGMRRIVITTPAGRAEIANMIAAGYDGYLVKPVRTASLAARFLPGKGELEHDDARDLGCGRAPASSNLSRALNVLVAEDNDINALLIRAMLGKLGHHVTVATNGNDAAASWRATLDAGERFDIVFMDIDMPGCDGIEATRRIRTVEAQTALAHTPIVALTANAFAEDRETCLAAGMDGLLVKPLDRERLVQILTNFCVKASGPMAA
ncbi:MAG: response regulator [Proteobacteria bacterium]|nr:response regulator [Pseudomonadota bacterium]